MLLTFGSFVRWMFDLSVDRFEPVALFVALVKLSFIVGTVTIAQAILTDLPDFTRIVVAPRRPPAKPEKVRWTAKSLLVLGLVLLAGYVFFSQYYASGVL